MQKILTVSLLTCLTISCSGLECKNNISTFDNLNPETSEYKAELINQIKIIGADNLTYHYDGYIKKDSLEYISINIEGDSLCAKGDLLVKDWTKLEKLRGNASGFVGAEFKGLKFELLQDSIESASLIFKDVDEIID